MVVGELEPELAFYSGELRIGQRGMNLDTTQPRQPLRCLQPDLLAITMNHRPDATRPHEYDAIEYAALPVNYGMSGIVLCCNVFQI